VFVGGNDRDATDMATKKTATKKTSGKPRKAGVEQSIESLLASLMAAKPPESEKDLARWALGKMLAEMVTKLLSGDEIKFASNDMLRVIQALKEYGDEEDKKKISGIKVEWVEPKKP
jgi:hypothetical protein